MVNLINLKINLSNLNSKLIIGIRPETRRSNLKQVEKYVIIFWGLNSWMLQNSEMTLS